MFIYYNKLQQILITLHDDPTKGPRSQLLLELVHFTMYFSIILSSKVP